MTTLWHRLSPVLEDEAPAVGDLDDVRVGHQLTTVEGAAAHQNTLTSVLWGHVRTLDATRRRHFTQVTCGVNTITYAET